MFAYFILLFILEENMRKDVKGYWQEWLVYLDLCLGMSQLFY